MKRDLIDSNSVMAAHDNKGTTKTSYTNSNDSTGAKIEGLGGKHRAEAAAAAATTVSEKEKQKLDKDNFTRVIFLSATALKENNGKKYQPNSTNGNSKSFCIDQESCNNSVNMKLKEKPENVDIVPRALFPGCGIVITFLASIFFSISTACVKEVVDNQQGMTGVELAFFRGLFLSASTGSIQLAKGQNLLVPREEVLINFLRGVFGSVGVFGLYMSMRYISMADATTISFSSPIWTFLLAYLILKERITWLQVIPLPLCILGVLMIAHPDLFTGGPVEIAVTTEQLLNDGVVYPEAEHEARLLAAHNHQAAADDAGGLFRQQRHNNSNGGSTPQPARFDTNTSSMSIGTNDNTVLSYSELTEPQTSHHIAAERIYGILLAFLCSISMAATNIVLKFRRKTPVQTVIFWFGLTTSAIASIMMFTFNGFVWPNSTKVVLLILANGAFSWLGQALFQIAFYYEDATVISLIRSMDVVMAFVISTLFLDEIIEWTSAVGALITVASVSSLILIKWYRSTKRIH